MDQSDLEKSKWLPIANDTDPLDGKLGRTNDCYSILSVPKKETILTDAGTEKPGTHNGAQLLL